MMTTMKTKLDQLFLFKESINKISKGKKLKNQINCMIDRSTTFEEEICVNSGQGMILQLCFKLLPHQLFGKEEKIEEQ